MRFLLSLNIVLMLGVFSLSAEPPVGRRLNELMLPDITTGKMWSILDAGREAKATVVVFLGTECPVSNAYVPTLLAIQEEYRDQGVRVVGINSNAHEDAHSLKKHAAEFGITFPMLQDASSAMADWFQAKRIPTAFVLDATRTVRYRGRIDDQYERGVKRPRPTHTELRDAVRAVLAGKDVAVQSTDVLGCPINRADTRKQPVVSAKVTYSKEVSRIVQKNCQSCHRPGEIGPFQLMNYEDAVAWAGAIREVVTEGIMPPWNADPQHGTFVNDRRLAPEDKQALLTWIDLGCPEGNKADLPEPAKYAVGWNIGEPDVVMLMNEEIKVPAQAPPGGVPYKRVLVGKPFAEERWVKAAEVRPDNRGVVHHILVYILKPGQNVSILGDVNNPQLLFSGLKDYPKILAGYVPGDHFYQLPEGEAKHIPKGSQLVFEIHYTPNGKAGADRSKLGLIFTKTKPQVILQGDSAVNFLFRIPPGAEAHRVEAEFYFDQTVYLRQMNPHMHARGKSFEYRLRSPDGKEEVLLKVPKFDFNWQLGYMLKEPKLIPKGSRLICIAYFDNSMGNPNNPDPTKRVRWGDQTWDEMMLGFFEHQNMVK